MIGRPSLENEVRQATAPIRRKPATSDTLDKEAMQIEYTEYQPTTVTLFAIGDLAIEPSTRFRRLKYRVASRSSRLKR